MSKLFITADTHFGHKEIITYENRPFQNVDEMNDAIIKNWNEHVAPNDTVFHLGDVGMCSKEVLKAILTKLNGTKILVMGNHDQELSVNEWMECGFTEVYRYPIIYHEFMVMQHEPPQYINAATPFYYLYGHVHGTKMYPTISTQSACVSMERWNYTPADLEEIKQLVYKLQKEC